MTLSSISPIDGRYADKVADLAPYFSEMALMKYRLMIEVEYFIALGNEKGVKELARAGMTRRPIRPRRIRPLADRASLRSIYENFSLKDAEAIKKIEKTTNHDVKAIEYFLKEKIRRIKTVPSLRRRGEGVVEFIHFALTSEDINNLAYTLMWQGAVKNVYLPALINVHHALYSHARMLRTVPMLALTHGQPATPTTVGKEFAIFAARLDRQIRQLKAHKLLGKLNGATGTWGAHVISYPQVNWPNFSKKFVSSLGLDINQLTTQIEPHDSLAESFHIIERINTILIDFTRDIWMYISRGIFGQKKKDGEIGSSTMPHKINPIQFENAEGNLGIANAYLTHLSQKLPVSRMQRDLTDSTVIRNQGVPLAHSLLACKSILDGMSRLTVNKQKLNEELDDHWEVLAEAIQIILRKVGYDKPYEKLKELTRGHAISKNDMMTFVQGLKIPKAEKEKLLKLTPQTYIGLASKLV